MSINTVLARTFSSSLSELTAAAVSSASLQPTAKLQAPSPILDQEMIERLVREGANSPERIRVNVNATFLKAIEHANLPVVITLCTRDEIAPSPDTKEKGKTLSSQLKGLSVGDLTDYAEIPLSQFVQLSKQKAYKKILEFLATLPNPQRRASTPPPRLK